VGDQRVPLAAVVADQLDDLPQPRDLLCLARLEAAQQLGDQRRAVGDLALAAEAQARVRDAQLDQLLLGQVLERADRPGPVELAWRGRGGRIAIPGPVGPGSPELEVVPEAAPGRAAEQVGQEGGPVGVEAGRDLLDRDERADLVAAVERRLLPQY